MKIMKKMFALVIATVMVLAMALPAMASATYVENQHTVSITTNGQEQHTYGAYQIFKGDLNATEGVLSNIVWGSAMTDTVVTALQTAIASNDTIKADFAGKTTAQQFAEVLAGSGYAGQDAEKTQAFADALNAALTTKTTTTAVTGTDGKATFTLPSDGYYFFRDDAKINGESDTYSRFVLQVVNDLDIKAKDTVLTPDKVILKEDETVLNGTDGVKANDSSIGDVITYQVTIPVPNTKLYKDHFVLVMHDKLEAGLTYFGNMSIKIDSQTLVADTNYKAVVKTGTEDFTVPTSSINAVTTAGGQDITVTFKDFKKYVEADYDSVTDGVQDLINKKIVISYDVVLNDDATFNEDSNDNVVYFNYSNNPNYTYEGDDIPDDTTVVGKTPDSITKTYVTKLHLFKKNGNGKALAGATFKLTGTSWNNVIETGERYELNTPTAYVAKTGETIETGTYYKLKDGSYTTTAPVTNTQNVNLDTTAQYETPLTNTYVKVSYKRIVTVAKELDQTLTSDKDGNIIVEGIEQGDFSVQEITAPDGYNLDNTKYDLKINWVDPSTLAENADGKNNGGFTKDSSSNAAWNWNGTDFDFHIEITNNSGSTLPSTGGIGTTIFYVIGGILVVLAGIVLVSKRKSAE